MGLCYRTTRWLERLSRLDDGRVRYTLKHPWPKAGGVTELLMEPVDFLARLTALIPAPHVNMVRYHGAFAPASPLRGLVVPRPVGGGRKHRLRSASSASAKWPDKADAADLDVSSGPRSHMGDRGNRQSRDASTDFEMASTELELCYLCGAASTVEEALDSLRSRRLDWAALLARVWTIDVLECPRCQGRMRVIAALSERSMVSKVLAHLNLLTQLPQPAPARAPPWWSDDELDLGQGAFDLEAKLDQRALQLISEGACHGPRGSPCAYPSRRRGRPAS